MHISSLSSRVVHRPARFLVGFSMFGVLSFIITLAYFHSTVQGYGPLTRYRHPVKGGYPYVKLEALDLKPPKPTTSPGKDGKQAPTAPPRVLVAAHPSTMDLMSFLPAMVPHWNISSQPIPLKFVNLRMDHKANKGRTANAYLTFIIENYYNLPETMVFLDANINGWDNSRTMQELRDIADLRTEFIQKQGYANLHCENATECIANGISTTNPPDTLRTLEVSIAKVWRHLFDVKDTHSRAPGGLKNGSAESGVQHQPVPERLAVVLGGDFTVSRDQVKKRGLDDYLRIWKWLNTTKMDDDTAGLLMEYLWHVVFGKTEEFCEEQTVCLCGLYGRC